ncbi:hypothetical protein BOSE62_130777 [Bosea sp. 62]|nr:hypothetical protein BOSE7B_120803 [Bosea sp. 7B]CAD5273941.1 hypothetical protein BOSE21B_30109 [Bosea sp. 21B]CAD5284180.1 hypothetical protein BOSE46_50140 [Bosea sp. 46]VVT60152.1 hypothetical protein BOS5A_210943 [Bosea sp. EC-HK365B]VXB57270.1 hypothetical protein BOSE62_130777 [Bosea sp. 62]VXC13153.1 hypothetical protein BOSE29B_30105 [Bosea sp. 29B]VXC19553.1 hypothetical protein BOSE127_170441 [Bosea sp. 127]
MISICDTDLNDLRVSSTFLLKKYAFRS